MPAPTTHASNEATAASRAPVYARLPGDPAIEARGWLEASLAGRPIPSLLLVIGLADGHLLDALEACGTAAKVIAIEPDPEAARTFHARRDWTHWTRAGRLLHLAGPQFAGAADAWRSFPASVDDCAMLVHPRLTQGPATADAVKVAQAIVAGARANAEARRRFAPRYLTNVVRNVPAMLRAGDVRALADAYRATPAVIAAAGPSLDAAIPRLAALADRALLIAVDTALRPLLTAGLAPQFVVGADPGAANARHFQWLPPCPDTWLVAESALDRSAAMPFDGRTLWFRLARHQPWPWLNQLGFDIGQVDMWGSVLTAAFQTAVLAGCDPIVIVGADLAFTNGQPYARGTTYEFDWAHGITIGVPLDEWWRVQIARGQLRSAPDVRGTETRTTTAMLSFRDWMVERARRSNRRVINAGGDGILHGPSIEQQSLQDVIRDLPARHIQSPGMVIGGAPLDGRETKAIEVALASVRTSVATGATTASPLAAWREFSGDGFDRAALSSALDAAVGQSSVEGGATGGNTGIDWAALAASREFREVLPRLPEAMVRFRTLMEGGVDGRPEGLPLPDFVERAWEVLTQVGVAAAALHDLEPIVESEAIARTAVSAAYRWPEHLRFAIEVVEALLGCSTEVWPSDGHVPFFWRAVSPIETPEARNEAVAPEGRLATRAVQRLAIYWLRSAVRESDDADRRALDRVLSILTAPAPADAPTRTRPALTIAVQNRGELCLAVDAPASMLSRALTGALRHPAERHLTLGRVGPAELQLSFVSDTTRVPRASSDPVEASFAMMPRVLTDEGAPDATVAYAAAGGVVCVRPHRSHSVIVRAGGSVQVHHQWPRPILSELPWGDAGAVAWGDGLSNPAAPTGGYVMYRQHPDARVEIQELPVRPTVGVWWRGRLYWSCYPRRVETWIGMVSWAPGEDIRPEMPGFPPLLGVHAEQDEIVLRPGTPRDGGGWRRLVTPEVWRWTPGSAPRAAAGDVLGTASGQAVSSQAGDGCTAIAYPESDVVRLRRADGRLFEMACYYPLRLAWVAGSLVVSTGERELLFFERLADAVERLP